MNNLVKIRLFKELGSFCGGKEWNLSVKSVAEAINALNTLTNNRFSKYFVENNKLYNKYRILINEKDFYSPEQNINENNWHLIKQSELIMRSDKIQTIDIVPFIENNDPKTLGIITTILAVVLIIAGFVVPGAQFLIPIGIGLLGAGVAALLARPPTLGNFRDIDKSGKESYLFSGPINIVGEGGPVPVGYGRVLVGSQVVSSAYKIIDYQTFRESNN